MFLCVWMFHSSANRIRTCDLKVMSLASWPTALPRYVRGHSHPPTHFLRWWSTHRTCPRIIKGEADRTGMLEMLRFPGIPGCGWLTLFCLFILSFLPVTQHQRPRICGYDAAGLPTLNLTCVIFFAKLYVLKLTLLAKRSVLRVLVCLL